MGIAFLGKFGVLAWLLPHRLPVGTLRGAGLTTELRAPCTPRAIPTRAHPWFFCVFTPLRFLSLTFPWHHRLPPRTQLK